jgi:hypothetical protein
MGDVWAMVHAERAALIGDLARLDDGQWDQPSLCAEWTVHDVVAHLVGTARATRIGFVAGMARARFDFDRQNARGVAPRKSTPPAPLDSRLVEEVVHGEDIRRPLGLTRAYPAEAVARSLGYQTRTPASFGGAKELMTRVRIVATDTDLTIGTGPEVNGPALSLLLAVSGRRAALDDLSGPGVGALGATQP